MALYNVIHDRWDMRTDIVRNKLQCRCHARKQNKNLESLLLVHLYTGLHPITVEQEQEQLIYAEIGSNGIFLPLFQLLGGGVPKLPKLSLSQFT